MHRALASVSKRTRFGFLLAGPLGGIAVVLLVAWMFLSATPTKPAGAAPQQLAGIPCSDGNNFDGDCCSANGIEEESRFGWLQNGPGDISSRAIECDLDNDGKHA